MPQRLPPTLGEVRQSLIIRCGLSSGGTVPPAAQAMLDERIRSAQTQIYELFPWTANYVYHDIPLEMGISDYDIPDDTVTGKIDVIAVHRISDDYLFELDRGINLEETNYNAPTLKTMPLRYMFVDGIVRVLPLPDTTYYDKLVMGYWMVPTPFVQDDERAAVDGEALKLYAEIAVKEHFGGMDTEGLHRAFAIYIDRVRAKQSDGSGFQMGGHQSLVTKTQRRNRFAWSGVRANTWRDWRPW